MWSSDFLFVYYSVHAGLSPTFLFFERCPTLKDSWEMAVFSAASASSNSMATAQSGVTIYWPWPPRQSPSTVLSEMPYYYSHGTDTAVRFWLFFVDLSWWHPPTVPPTANLQWIPLWLALICPRALLLSRMMTVWSMMATTQTIMSPFQGKLFPGIKIQYNAVMHWQQLLWY